MLPSHLTTSPCLGDKSEFKAENTEATLDPSMVPPELVLCMLASVADMETEASRVNPAVPVGVAFVKLSWWALRLSPQTSQHYLLTSVHSRQPSGLEGARER